MKKDWWSREFERIVTLGESTTAGGWSSSRERCWASRLVALINDVQEHPATLFNAGIGANVISTRSPAYDHSGKPAADERLAKHVIERNPDLLVISYGINDARGGTPLWLFAQALEQVIDRIRDQIQPLIVLLGPYLNTGFRVGGEVWAHASMETFDAFSKIIHGVAVSRACLFVDILGAYANTPWMVHFDGVHANDIGHLVVANRVFEAIAQNCSGIARRTQQKEAEIPPWRDESTLATDYGYARGESAVPRK